LNAQNAGAHRIELCEKHSIGGITPSKDFLVKAFEIIKIPTNVLIRPRGGNFIFSDREIEIMIDQFNRNSNSSKKVAPDKYLISAKKSTKK